ncbi:MAG: GNAT family N-acetyltransferase [Oscillospiraceae bacterium]|nr:GNAT family N-acetyltransferase [Oscillospiraceae bacterium]
MIIDHPTEKDIPALRALWREAFSDPDTFIELFFTRGFAPERSLTVKEGEKVLAALYWFDCAWEENESAYIYGVATKMEHRGKGLCNRLMDRLHRDMEKMGKSTVLVPVNESLRAFYAQMGYRDFGGMEEALYCPAGAPVAVERLSATDYMQKRKGLLPAGGIAQEGETLPFLEGMLTFYGGEGWLLAAYQEEGKWICPEFLGDKALLSGILKALDIPSAMVRIAGERPFAMYRPMHKEEKGPAYFAFALD